VDTPFQLLLCVYCLGKAAAALLELAVFAWALGPPALSSGRVVSSRARLLSPRRCPLLASRLVLGMARTQADLLALVYFALSAAVAGMLAIPLSVAVAVLVAVTLMLLTGRLAYDMESATSSFDGISGLQGTLTSVTGQSVVVTTLLVSAVILAHAALGGQWPRERNRFAYSKMRFVWQTLNLNALHHWLLMNVKVSRFLAEKAAVQEQTEAVPSAQYYSLSAAPPLYGGATRASSPPPPAEPLSGFRVITPQSYGAGDTRGLGSSATGVQLVLPPPGPSSQDPTRQRRVSINM